MFDTEKFLKDHFPDGPQQIQELIRRQLLLVVPPREGTADKWFRRKSIPADWFGLLLIALESRDKKPVSLARYLV